MLKLPRLRAHAANPPIISAQEFVRSALRDTARSGSETRPWGMFDTLETSSAHQVKRLEIKSGQRISYQRHQFRAEHWFCVAGEGLATVDDRKFTLEPGQSVDVPIGVAHRIENVGANPLVVIEVQSGTYFGDDDIVRLDDDYGRAGIVTLVPTAPGTATPTISLVIPTFNEAESVGFLLAEIDAALKGIDYEAIIVDDSTDATPEIVAKAAEQYPVRLIHREGADARKGLGSAVVEGFQGSLGKYICVMDADLQHPPSVIPAMLARAELTDADVIVPSRYIPGGSYEGLDNAVRKLASVGLKELARLVFFPRLNAVTDPLSGFFLIRSDRVRDAQLDPKGFKILLEVLVRCQWQSVAEVPYVFRARQNGESKASMKQGLTYFQHLLHLVRTVPSAARLGKFAFVGASGLVVNLGAIALLQASGAAWPAMAIWSAAKLLSIATNFQLNRWITFPDRPASSNIGLLGQFAGFVGASAAGVAIDLALVLLLQRQGVPLLVAESIAIPVAMLANFWLTNRLAFREREPASWR